MGLRRFDPKLCSAGRAPILLFLFAAVAFSITGCATTKAAPSAGILELQKKAVQGDAKAQLSLGIDYEYGLGVPQDYGKTFELFQLAAQQGYPEAEEALASLYDRGKGVRRDYAQAASFWLKAAQKKYLPSYHCYSLARIYEQGKGVTRDPEQAFKWYVRSRDAGDNTAYKKIMEMEKKYGFDSDTYSLDGLFLQAWQYEHGLGVAQDLAKALSLYREAAQSKFGRAQERLGYLYMTGQGVAKDYQEAAKWYKMASMEYSGHSMLSYVNRRGSDKYTEDGIVTPRVKEKKVLGGIIGIANKKGQYDRQSVSEYQARIEQGKPVMAGLPRNFNNMERCVRMAGIPESCAGQIFQRSGIPVLGDIDCVICAPSADIDYTPGSKMKEWHRPYRR
jgi:TPR repeat protein